MSPESGGWTPIGASPHYAPNLECLGEYHPDAARKVEQTARETPLWFRRAPGGFFEAGAGAAGGVERILGEDEIRAGLPGAEALLARLGADGAPLLVYCLGFDLGYTLERCVPVLNRFPQAALAAAEPDARLLACGMAARDLRAYFQSNRLMWIVGGDFGAALDRLNRERHLFAAARPDILFASHARHPRLIPVWKRFRQAAADAAARGRREYEAEIEGAIRHYAEKRPDRIETVMAPHHAGGMAIQYIQKRLLDEWRRLGAGIVHYHSAFLNEIHFARAIARERPDALLFINRSPGEYVFPSVLNAMRLPRAVWCIDDPNCFIRDPFHPHDFVFTWDASYAGDLKRMGAAAVDEFPYTADMDAARPEIRDEFRSPASYIGQVRKFDPGGLGLGEAEARLARLAAERKAAEPGLDYPAIVWAHQREFGVDAMRSPDDPLPRTLRYGIYTLANARRRIEVLERALPYGLAIYGNEDWAEALAGHPLREAYRGPADPVRDVPSIFVSSSVNLNIHSLQAQASLNQRDFNCPLLGGFLLTDWVEGADRFFEPGREMAFYRSADELPGLIGHYLNHPAERRAIAERGRERVSREHTYAARTPGFLETLRTRIRERFGQ